MTAFEAVKMVSETNWPHLIRERKMSPAQYDVKLAFTRGKREWFYLDCFTASAIIALHASVSDSSKATLEAYRSIERLAAIAVKHCA